MSLRHTRNLRDRFLAIGVSNSLACQLQRQVSQWESCSGPEWTVKRLKDLKAAFMKRIAGENYTLSWFKSRVDARGPIPKGPFGALWDKTGSDITSIARTLNALMVYSDFKATLVTETQVKKFTSSVCRDPIVPEVLQVCERLITPKWMKVKSARLDTFEEFVVSKGYTPEYISKQLDLFVESDTGQALWAKYPQYLQSFSTISKEVDTRIGMDDYFGYHPPLSLSNCCDPVGILGYTQEPGYKLRVFASPNICHQLALSRMKAQLFTLLHRVPWDCTYNQTSGTDWIQVQLKQGKRLFSIDLSDATNNFPLHLQMKVFRDIGISHEDMWLFKDLAQSPWLSTWGNREKYSWSVGQPLGLGPSFAAFALTHGVLVDTIARECRCFDHPFRILGDDIVISEESVASRYLETLAILGIPVSKDKTIVSSSFAEFAGKVVTPQGVISALKWREASDRSFLDIARLIGPKSRILLRKRQRKVLDFVSILPEPEGFGWNPNGVSLDVRVQLLDMFKECQKERIVKFSRLQSAWDKIRRNFGQSYLKLRFTERWDSLTGKASEKGSRDPTPVGSIRHLLSIAEMTNSDLSVPEEELTPQIRRLLRERGFTTPPLTTDPRGLTTLEDLELKIAKLHEVMEQLGIKLPCSQ
jgi:hypothetical protein